MSDVTNKLIIWGLITVLSIIIAFICYRWLSNVARFENRKKEIIFGMVVCVLGISSFMFMPVVFSRINLSQFCENLLEQIQYHFLKCDQQADNYCMHQLILRMQLHFRIL